MKYYLILALSAVLSVLVTMGIGYISYDIVTSIKAQKDGSELSYYNEENQHLNEKCNEGSTLADWWIFGLFGIGDDNNNGCDDKYHFCGDDACNEEETCNTCATDCGSCFCGDGQCNEEETCQTCQTDCGICNIGDEICNDTLDNDDDGQIDCNDTECKIDPACCLDGLCLVEAPKPLVSNLIEKYKYEILKENTKPISSKLKMIPMNVWSLFFFILLISAYIIIYLRRSVCKPCKLSKKLKKQICQY